MGRQALPLGLPCLTPFAAPWGNPDGYEGAITRGIGLLVRGEARVNGGACPRGPIGSAGKAKCLFEHPGAGRLPHDSSDSEGESRHQYHV